MNNDVSGWVNGSLANYGWMIYDYPGSAYTARKFDSRQGTNPPQLQISYYKPLGATCGANSECGTGACTNSHCCNTFSCPAQNECQSSPPVCGGSGTCSNPAKGDGTACSSDGDPCTVDECITGSCQHPAGNNGAVCTDDGNPCTSDVCNGSAASPGGCTHPAGNNGAACPDDGNPCTSDVCSGGGCSHPGGNNGASCNDNNACTQTDTCSGGGCVGSSPVACPAIDECHTAGTCDPSTGVCSTPAKADGTGCTADANPCTLDECLSGVCSHPAGNAGAACTDDGNACTNDQCNGSSATCQHPAKTSGTACTADTNPCTLDQCDGAGNLRAPPRKCRAVSAARRAARVQGGPASRRSLRRATVRAPRVRRRARWAALARSAPAPCARVGAPRTRIARRAISVSAASARRRAPTVTRSAAARTTTARAATAWTAIAATRRAPAAPRIARRAASRASTVSALRFRRTPRVGSRTVCATPPTPATERAPFASTRRRRAVLHVRTTATNAPSTSATAPKTRASTRARPTARGAPTTGTSARRTRVRPALVAIRPGMRALPVEVSVALATSSRNVRGRARRVPRTPSWPPPRRAGRRHARPASRRMPQTVPATDRLALRRRPRPVLLTCAARTRV